MPDTPPPASVDAILCSSHYPRLKPGEDRHQKLREEFAPVLGSPLIYSRPGDLGRSVTFITAQPNDAKGRGIARFFGTGHALQGRDRYAWTDRGDGVYYGVLTEQAKADEQTV
jgi:hypothetical protein